jgi:hypothetical protein
MSSWRMGSATAVARSLGLCAATRGDRSAAIAHFEAAARTYRAMGAGARLAHAERDLTSARGA